MTDTPIRAKAREELRRLRTLCESTWRSHRDPRDYAYNECEGDDECLWCAETRDAIEKLDALLREADPGRIAVEDLADALQDRIVPASGRLLSAKPIKADPPAGETLDRPIGDDEWQRAALAIGEHLSPNGPEGYYKFNAREWWLWAGNVLGEKAASPTLSEPELTHEEQCAYGEMEQHNVLMRRRAPVSPAAQPEEHHGQEESGHRDRHGRENLQDDVRPVREAVPLEAVRVHSHGNQGGALAASAPKAQEVTPLPVRQRIEQAADDAFEAVMKRMHPDVHYDSCERAAEFAAAREALIILRDDHVERLKAAAELCVTQAVNDGRRYHWRGYAEAMEDMKLVIKDLLSSLTDQETTR